MFDRMIQLEGLENCECIFMKEKTDGRYSK